MVRGGEMNLLTKLKKLFAKRNPVFGDGTCNFITEDADGLDLTYRRPKKLDRKKRKW